jgi:hypothetical protein
MSRVAEKRLPALRTYTSVAAWLAPRLTGRADRTGPSLGPTCPATVGYALKTPSSPGPTLARVNARSPAQVGGLHWQGALRRTRAQQLPGGWMGGRVGPSPHRRGAAACEAGPGAGAGVGGEGDVGPGNDLAAPRGGVTTASPGVFHHVRGLVACASRPHNSTQRAVLVRVPITGAPNVCELGPGGNLHPAVRVSPTRGLSHALRQRRPQTCFLKGRSSHFRCDRASPAGPMQSPASPFGIPALHLPVSCISRFMMGPPHHSCTASLLRGGCPSEGLT